MTEPTTAAPAPRDPRAAHPLVTPPRPRRPRRWPGWLLRTAVWGALLLAVLVTGLFLSLSSDSGTRWWLQRLPGVTVEHPRGALLGNFSAQRVHVELPGGDAVTLTELVSRGLSLSRPADGSSAWLRLEIAELQARRIDLQQAPRPDDAPPSDPLVEPTRLRLPLELRIGALDVGELHAPALGDRPVRGLHASLHLGADGGATHRLDGLRLDWDRLRVEGSARIGADAPLTLDARLAASQSAPAPGAATAAQASAAPPAVWQAQAQLSGPLASPVLQATLRAAPSVSATPRPAAGNVPAAAREQTLDLRASLRPFEPWPLAGLEASTQGLDLSAFHSAAPLTSLSGKATAQTRGMDQPALLQLTLTNAEAGLWNAGRLPLRQVDIDLQGQPSDTSLVEIRRFEAELGTRSNSAGRIQGQGRVGNEGWNLDARLTDVRPNQLDARAAAMRLSGPVTVWGTGLNVQDATVHAKANLAGSAVMGLKKPLPVQVRLDTTARTQAGAAGNAPQWQVELRQLQASAGAARASLSGRASQTGNGPLQLKAQARLVDFDPVPWWPGREDSPWRKGPHQLNAQADVDVSWPLAAAPSSPARPRAPADATPAATDALAGLRGTAQLTLARSLLAGVPLSGEARLKGAEAGALQATARLELDGNQLSLDGRLATGGPGMRAGNALELTLAAPALDRLSPLLPWLISLPADAPKRMAGSLRGTARITGQWPQLRTEGRLDSNGVVAGPYSLQRGEAQWQIGTAADAPANLQASFTNAAFQGQTLETVELSLQGSARSHRLELRGLSKAQPPPWVDTSRGADTTPPGDRRTAALLQVQGGLLMGSAASATPGQATGWRGSLQRFEVRAGPDAGGRPWLNTRDVGIEALWGQPAPSGRRGAAPPAPVGLRVTVDAGRATVSRAVLRWSRIAWQGAAGNQPARLDAEGALDPVPVAALLARLQPNFGWGGDLTVSGRFKVRSAPTFSADVVLERNAGDLTVTEETVTQSLGLTDLRLALNAEDGVWSFTQGLAGKTLGVAAGAVVARTSPTATWPAPDTPIQGVLELQVANLGAWGTWVPAGWRLGGALRVSAGIGGRFGAPEYTGEIHGRNLGARNLLEGVNVTDGTVDITLQGATARIERFTAKGGDGTLRLEGGGTLGASPQAQLDLVAEKFQLLGRVDRRIVTSGQARLSLDADSMALDGKFTVDEGLIDFTRGDAPTLSDDVEVVRANTPRGPPQPAAGDTSADTARQLSLNLEVNLGEQLRLRGRGLQTGLRGNLRLTAPDGKLAVNGRVRTDGGSYNAYGQRLTIDRGQVTFNGPINNPRLDIEATRPNTEVRVGVAITGTAANPRVRLFSEPELSDIDKLSWLILGRASDSLGRADAALMQRAAFALLAGEGESKTDQLINAIGLDELSLRQDEGELRGTIITLGKQLSERWFVGYERSLNATEGSWQLIYRIAQRFTLRAQSGLDTSLDLIWSWRWQ